jgi:hypothetical protein
VSLTNSAYRLSGTDPLAPVYEGTRRLVYRTISMGPALQRARRLGRLNIPRGRSHSAAVDK